LRGVAALGVLSFHVVVSATHDFPQLDSLYLLVDFFFVLSGFVLWPSIPQKASGLGRATGTFVLKRVFRFWPLVIVALLVATFVLQIERDWLMMHDNFDPPFGAVVGVSTAAKVGIYTSAYLLLQIFVPAALFINVPLWSLSAEWIANLIYAPLAWIKYSLGIVGLILVGYGMLAFGLFADQDWIIGPDGFSGIGPIRGFEALGRAMIGFGLGLLLRKHLDVLARFRNWWLLALALVLIALMPVWVAETGFMSYRYSITLWAAPVFALLIWQVSKFQVRESSWWGKFLAFLGTYSFGIYVFHQPLMQAYNVIFGTPSGPFIDSWWSFFLLEAAGLTFVCILITFIARILVERPLQRFGKKLITRVSRSE
jgi:peptidoglycan/LPS O-acetylase OafA/YrhL